MPLRKILRVAQNDFFSSLLTPADVYAALAYYFDHRAEIDQTIKEGEAFVKAMRQRAPSPVRRKLGKRKGDGAAR